MSSLKPGHAVAIGPSVLSADFLRLGDQLREMEEAGADYIHFDVMDGRFVPNISIGLPVLEAIRRGTTLPIDVHLMVVEPDLWVEPFRDAGADAITFHVEAAPHPHRVAESIAACGAKVGVALNPGTSLTTVEELLPFVDQVLVMTVNPGFGGQSFIDTMVDKTARLRQRLDTVNPGALIQVDGGINEDTIGRIVAAGAASVVAGTAVLNDERPIVDNVAILRAAVDA